MKIRILVLAAAMVLTACGKSEHGEAGNARTAGKAPGQEAAATAADWCAEHAIAESVCTKCDPSLVAKFKAAGDWCGEHGFPESHCPLCKGMESGHTHSPAATGETGPIRAD